LDVILTTAYRLFPRSKSNGEALVALSAVVSGVIGSLATLATIGLMTFGSK
jgi:hypothetical protein